MDAMLPKATRVLIVDDDYLVMMVIRDMLENEGYIVAGEASCGRDAVRMTREIRPDVIIMDLQMPDIDGLEAARMIYDCCPTPIVMLTAYESPELVQEAGEAGAGAYIVKPPSLQELERAILIARTRFEDMMRLREANETLRKRNEALDAFARIVAHDLKNPLQMIVGFAEMLENYGETLPPEELRRSLATISRNARKMGHIINELLLLAQMRQDGVEVYPVNMAEIVASALERMEYLAIRRRAHILTPDRWPNALGYAPWVEEVWVNYINNAIKYGGDPPEIELGADLPRGGMIRFWVRDNGPGVPAEARAKLFQPFQRFHPRRVSGYGLGLSIVRTIIERLGGEVGVEDAPGGGAIFWFTLPASSEEQADSVEARS